MNDRDRDRDRDRKLVVKYIVDALWDLFSTADAQRRVWEDAVSTKYDTDKNGWTLRYDPKSATGNIKATLLVTAVLAIIGVGLLIWTYRWVAMWPFALICWMLVFNYIRGTLSLCYWYIVHNARYNDDEKYRGGFGDFGGGESGD